MPIQLPIPIWIGANSEVAVRRAVGAGSSFPAISREIRLRHTTMPSVKQRSPLAAIREHLVLRLPYTVEKRVPTRGWKQRVRGVILGLPN